jgi:multidrug efflux pump subunit AcrA (membrane-fusion protein)
VINLVDAIDSPVSAGMGCRISLTTYEQPKALTVPVSSVQAAAGDDESYVYLVDGDGHARRTVKTGRRDGDQIEIVKGLKAGDEILLTKPEGE